MSSKVLVIPGAGMGAALMEAMLLADRGSHVPMIDAMAYEQALRLGTDPMDEMLMRMIMPDRPARSLPQLLSNIAALEIEALLARRARPFRPTGSKRTRRRRRGR